MTDGRQGQPASEDYATLRDIGVPDGALRFSLQRRRPGGRNLRG